VRQDGYVPIEDYGVVGDGRTVALIARDGSVDWLCIPDVDSPSVFGAILDAERGGRFVLQPEGEFSAERRYVEDTNVLETTYRTPSGAARVLDAMTLGADGTLVPLREFVRRVEGLSGTTRFVWSFEPRFDYGRRLPRLERRAGRIVAADGKVALALGTFGVPDASIHESSAGGRFELRQGETALLVLSAAGYEPLVLPGPADAGHRLDATMDFWRAWAAQSTYDGHWRSHVVRSALALKLMVYSPSGAIVAAPTASLPEWIGGERNWDYRYAWVRDAALTLSALLDLGYEAEPRAFFWWLAHATALTHPRLEVLYTVEGKQNADEQQLSELEGYRGSRPVRAGNGATSQLQLDVYGYALHAFRQHALAAGELTGAQGRTVAKIADWVAEHWSEPDSGIWEVRSEPAHFTQSKAMCAVALECACDLADDGLIPDRSERWRTSAAAVRRFVDEHCVDERSGSYVRSPRHPEADASLLTLPLLGYEDPRSQRSRATLERIRAELCENGLVDRYRGEDGVQGPQGIFLTCSFWFVSALARAGELEEATALMDDLTGRSNDVGLFSEEVDRDGRFLGNIPQGLVHLALIGAALDLDRAGAAA
jgi:GH15 family glucan-1,4-alpha-glucosidase